MNKGFLLLLCSCLGCGYTFQNSKNPLKAQGIESLYLEPVENNSYYPGLENLLHHHLTRQMLMQGQLKLVPERDQADAVLKTIVQSASFRGLASSPVSGLNPQGLAERYQLPTLPFAIATEYLADLECHLSLVRRRGPPQEVWGATLRRTKPFPSANQLGIAGTTSGLINEAEFYRTLDEMVESMMSDVHEFMLGVF